MGSGLTLITVVITLVFTWVALIACGWVVSIHRARNAADLSALAAAAAVVSGANPCAVAGRVAARNDATVHSCRVEGDATAFAVRVTVAVPLAPRLRVAGAPRVALADAVAGPAAER